MHKQIKFALLIGSFALLSACGGGGGDSGGSSYAPVTYMNNSGYKWSSTTNETVINPSGLFFGLEKDASGYCSQQTCDIDQFGKSVNCKATNFNGELGWSLPSRDQLTAFYNANPKPAGWSIGPTWSSSGGWSLDFRNGSWSYSGSSTSSKAYVSCIKKM